LPLFTQRPGRGVLGSSQASPSYRPDRYPTIEEYRRLEAEWSTPLYASGEEADAAFLAAHPDA
jgi:hypothetical protein